MAVRADIQPEDGSEGLPFDRDACAAAMAKIMHAQRLRSMERPPEALIDLMRKAAFAKRSSCEWPGPAQLAVHDFWPLTKAEIWWLTEHGFVVESQNIVRGLSGDKPVRYIITWPE